MSEVDMIVEDVSVASNVSTNWIEADLSGHIEGTSWSGTGEVRLRLRTETARLLRDMLTDGIEHQDAGGHGG